METHATPCIMKTKFCAPALGDACFTWAYIHYSARLNSGFPSTFRVFLRSLYIKADSHIACRAHAVPLPRHATKGLECVFPIWFTQCDHVRFTLAMPCPCHSSQGHGTARPSRDSLWATCPHSASSSYHAEFHEDCYQKHTNPPHNDPYLWL
jgi:hypothetical protein